MYRMSQRLLIGLIIFLSILILILIKRVFAWEWKLTLNKAPDGTYLYHPMSVVYAKGKIYVVDTGNSRLISYNAKGKPLVAVNPGGKLKTPLDLAFDQKDNLWVIERSRNELLKINFKKREVNSFKLYYKGKELFLERLVYVSPYLYILDRETGGIAFVDVSNGTPQVKRIWIPDEKNFSGFIDFKVKKDGIWALERNTFEVFYLDKNNKLKIWKLPKNLIYPISIEISGNYLLVMDRYLRKIFIFDLNKNFKLIGNFLEMGWTKGRVYLPWEIKMSPLGLLIVDEGNGKVEIWGR